MLDRTGTHKLNRHIAVSSAFLVLALAGWGAFAYTARSSAEQQSALAEQVRRISVEHEQLRSERDRLMAEQRDRSALTAEVDYLTSRVTALEVETRTLAQDRDRARAELAAAQQENASLQERTSEQVDADGASATGTTSKPTRRGFRGRRTRSR
ncbi:MAG TPA: hypothetical protein VHG30_18915 [Microvirga sp.]|nr:hypothetical protein [Microvirga sp.]